MIEHYHDFKPTGRLSRGTPLWACACGKEVASHREAGPIPRYMYGFTDHQCVILGLLVEGLHPRDIAVELGIHRRTVATCLRDMRKKSKHPTNRLLVEEWIERNGLEPAERICLP